MKWKWFLPLWLVIFLLAPSLIFPQAFLMTRSSPDDPGLPAVIPFGAVHWFQEWDFLLEREASVSPDGRVIKSKIGWVWEFIETYSFCILPILIYTFIVSLGLYFLGRFVFRKIESRKNSRPLPAT